MTHRTTSTGHPLQLVSEPGGARVMESGDVAVYASRDNAARSVVPITRTKCVALRVVRGGSRMVLVGRIAPKGAA
jgi:hypothetical protein